MRIKRLNREASLIVAFRKHGYSMNIIAKFLGRSTSFIHRILKFNALLGFKIGNLKRKIKPLQRRMALARMERNLLRFGNAWLVWLLSDEGKPP